MFEIHLCCQEIYCFWTENKNKNISPYRHWYFYAAVVEKGKYINNDKCTGFAVIVLLKF